MFIFTLLKAGDFIGKTSLQEIKSAGLKRKLCFLTLHGTDEVDPEGDETVLLNDEVSFTQTKSGSAVTFM